MAEKPELTDVVLKELLTLAMINERFRNMQTANPEHFHEMAEEMQRKYNTKIKPVLEPFAPHYSQIKSQMEWREQIYKSQLLK
jgi:hypothetical protein